MEVGTWIALAGLFVSLVSVAVAGARMQGEQKKAIENLETRHEKYRQDLQSIYTRLSDNERATDKAHETIQSIRENMTRIEQLQTIQNEKIDRILESVYSISAVIKGKEKE